MTPAFARPSTRSALNQPLPNGTGYSTLATPKPKPKKPTVPAVGPAIPGRSTPPLAASGLDDILGPPRRRSPVDQMLDGPSVMDRLRMGTPDGLIGGQERFGKYTGGETAYARGNIIDIDSLPPTRRPFDSQAAGRRDAAIAALNSDPAAIASRQRSQQMFAPVANQDLLAQRASPAFARRTDLTPRQQQSFMDRKAARDAELDLRKQRIFSRAQFREAAAGRGSVYEDDGGLDLQGTLAVRSFFENLPTQVEVDPRTRQRDAVFGARQGAMDALNTRQSSIFDHQAEVAKQQAMTLDRLLELGKNQDAHAAAMAGLAEDGRQFDLRLGFDNSDLDARRRNDKRKNKTDNRRLTIEDLLNQHKLEVERQRLEELKRQGAFDRSLEPHRREIEIKETAPNSRYRYNQ